MTTVIHCREAAALPADQYVYCGRPSKWGNPYSIGTHGPRVVVLQLFRRWWYAPEQAELRLQAVRELTGKTLGCWCKPKPCHVDIIADYVNAYAGPSSSL